MATIKADNRTKADNPTGENILAPGPLGGRVRVMRETITLAAQSANDIIELFQDLKAGANILDFVIDNDQLGGGVLLDVGDSNDVDRYINGYDAQANVTNRGAITAVTGQFQSATGRNYVIGTNTGDSQILCTILVAAATGVLETAVFYTED